MKLYECKLHVIIVTR